MNTDKIPTAESADWQIRDYISKLVDNNCREIPWEGTEVDKTTIKQEFIEFLKNHRVEFAKFHVKAALETAYNNSKILRQPTGEGESSEIYLSKEFEGDLGYEDYIPVSYTIDKDSILNAYPEENIK